PLNYANYLGGWRRGIQYIGVSQTSSPSSVTHAESLPQYPCPLQSTSTPLSFGQASSHTLAVYSGVHPCCAASSWVNRSPKAMCRLSEVIHATGSPPRCWRSALMASIEYSCIM